MRRHSYEPDRGAARAVRRRCTRPLRPSPTPISRTSKRSASASPRSSGWSSKPRSAAPASRISRPTSTFSSTSRRSRSAGPGIPRICVKIGPAADDLVDRYDYHLDFPGNALDPGCDYELWARRLTTGSAPTVYAHVATDPSHPEQLALQYWLFYPFNVFNNLHEGDWEMIQLVFAARDAREALDEEPESSRLQLARRRGTRGLG